MFFAHHTHQQAHTCMQNECACGGGVEREGGVVLFVAQVSLSCCGIVCSSGESLTEFWRHGRSECDDCQKGENSTTLEHIKRKNIGQSSVDAEMRLSCGEKVELSKSKDAYHYLIIVLWMLSYSAILCPQSQAGSVCSCRLQFWKSD